MIQVVMQNAIRRLKSKWKLPAPPSADNPADSQKLQADESEGKDKSGFILKFFLIAAVVLLIVFSNVLP
ncbi:MAG: hypothetical protein KGN99_09410 [Pseudomonadota bacterium]|nr:hypothetical protein [Pseudomonadota bacterium]